MDDQFISAADIIRQGLLSEDELVRLTVAGNKVAHEPDGKPVDFEWRKRQFEEIQQLCKEEDHEVVTRKASVNPYTGAPSPEKRSTKRFCRINPVPDEYLATHGMVKVKTIPWDALHKLLAERDIKAPALNIPESQYYEIIEGWTNERSRKVVLKSLFLKEGLPEKPEPEISTHSDWQDMPEELRICNEAWTALYKGKEPDQVARIRKQQIVEWVKKNCPNVERGPTELKRISTVVNPHKKGGATPT